MTQAIKTIRISIQGRPVYEDGKEGDEQDIDLNIPLDQARRLYTELNKVFLELDLGDEIDEADDIW